MKLHRDLINLNKDYDNILDLGDKQKILNERVKIFNLRLEEEKLKQPKGYQDNLNKNDVEILGYFRKPVGKREISTLTGNSLCALHHTKGKLKNMGFIEIVSWKNKESLLKITFRGEKVLNSWCKTQKQKEKEFKEKIFKLYLGMYGYFKRDPTIEELCLNMQKLSKRKFYQLWGDKKRFEGELDQYTRFIKSSSSVRTQNDMANK